MMVSKFLYQTLCGFFLGISIFAPGFSASIIAIAMGIYHDLLRIISNPFKALKKNIIFCLPLAIGALISAVLFIFTFKYLFDTHTKATYLLFVGLITGNLPIIFGEVKKSVFKKHYLIGGISAFAVALILGVFSIGIIPAPGADRLAVSIPLLLLGGFVAGIAMLVPGMSVTIVLMIFGIYNQLITEAEALLHLDFSYIVPIGLFLVCTVAGLAAASRGIKYVFEKYPGLSNTTVFGFITGALIGVFVQGVQVIDPSFNWLLGCAALVVGLGISMLFAIMGKKVNKVGFESEEFDSLSQN